VGSGRIRFNSPTRSHFVLHSTSSEQARVRQPELWEAAALRAAHLLNRESTPMTPKTTIPRRSRRAMVPGIDHLKSRQLLSTVVEPVHGPVPAHPHHGMGVRQAAVVARARSGHHGATSAVTTATSTSFSTVAQFIASFNATVAIGDDDIWAVGGSTASGAEQPFAAHFNGTSWSAVTTPTLPRGGSSATWPSWPPTMCGRSAIRVLR
jgi:hypothetical protein